MDHDERATDLILNNVSLWYLQDRLLGAGLTGDCLDKISIRVEALLERERELDQLAQFLGQHRANGSSGSRSPHTESMKVICAMEDMLMQLTGAVKLLGAAFKACSVEAVVVSMAAASRASNKAETFLASDRKTNLYRKYVMPEGSKNQA